MRLSEIKGERVFDVIAEIIEPAFNIATDPVASSIFKRGDMPDDVDPKEYAIKKAKESLPTLLRSHKNDLVRIMAATNGVDPDEYIANVTMPSLIKGVYEIMTDEDLLGFLS